MKKVKRQLNKQKVAVKVNNLSKKFIIPHEKISSMRGAFVSLFKNKSYEEFLALNDISFEVKKGEFFGIIGKNGSGKSTLLKLLAGIYQPDSGKIKINGMISPFLELGIGFNPELSGRDNIFLNAAVLGMSKRQVKDKFDEIIRFAELERFVDQKLKNYSSGMQVRLAFAVSVFANRDILLMDEVLAVGDSNFQNKCLREFKKYKTLGRTVVIVTHDISVVQKYCDRAMLINKGDLVAIGNVDKVVDTYFEQSFTEEEVRMIKEQKARKLAEKKLREKAEKKVKEEEKKRRILEEKQRKEEENRVKEAEEKRIEDERKKREKEELEKIRLKKETAEIVDVKFLDKDGKEKDVFETGESLIVEVKIFANSKITRPLVGFSIENKEKVILFGTNNKKRNLIIKEFKEKTKNVIRFKFDLNLFEGKYFINLAVSDEKSYKRIVFDSKKDKYIFCVDKNKSGEYGFLNLKPSVYYNN